MMMNGKTQGSARILVVDDDPMNREVASIQLEGVGLVVDTAEDGAEAIILGCAGMAEMCKDLSETLGLPVIDGVVAAVKLAEALASGGFATSKAGSLAYPRDKSADKLT